MFLAGAAHAGPVTDVLAGVRAHGYGSPAVVLQQLDAAAARTSPQAPLARRCDLQSAIARFAIEASDSARAEQALVELTAMAVHERCSSCRGLVLVRRAELLLSHRDGNAAERLLDQAAADIPMDVSYPHMALLLARSRQHNVQGEFGQGIGMAVEAMRLADQLASTSDRLRAMIMLVGMNADMGDLGRAEKIGKDAARLAASIGSHYQLGMARLQQGYVYALDGKPAQQLEALHDALRTFQGEAGNARHTAITLANIADYHLQHRQPKQAMDYARRAEALASRIGDTNSRAVALANMGIAAAQMRRLPEARLHLTQAIKLAEGMGTLSYLIAMNEELVKVEQQSGRLAAALAAMQRVLALNRKLSGEERQRTSIELQEKYAADAREREIERLRASESLRASQQRVRMWQHRVWVSASVTLALAMVLLIAWLKRIRHDARRLAVDNQALVHESSRDPLTGAFNRRYAQALLRRLQTDAVTSVGVIMLDLDLFKHINDTYGHHAGDAVLVEVARRLQRLAREQDAVVRWGGEEFVVVLPNTGIDGAASMARRVLFAVGQNPVRTGSADVPVTVSIGCVHSPLVDGADWDDAMQVADLALYLSKTHGRNRLTIVAQVMPGADMTLMRRDLMASSAKGDIVLRTVMGPEAASAEALAHGRAHGDGIGLQPSLDPAPVVPGIPNRAMTRRRASAILPDGVRDTPTMPAS